MFSAPMLGRENVSVEGMAMAKRLVGIGLILVALFLSVPVAVNMPDAWPGALLAFALLVLGVALLVGDRADRTQSK